MTVSSSAAIAKLARVFGAAKAQELATEVMRVCAISSLDDPNHRLRFARELIQRGGVLEAIGNSIAVQAILEGAGSGTATPRAERPSPLK